MPQRLSSIPPYAKHAPVLDAVKQTTLDSVPRAEFAREGIGLGKWIHRQQLTALVH